jgi:flagellar biosynthesis protein FlhG
MAKVELELFREPSDEGEERPGTGKAPKVVAISGAKGGVGKTLLASNLAVYLATIGRRVVIVDADSSGANVHGFLGVPHPAGLEPYVPPLPNFKEESKDDAAEAPPPPPAEQSVADESPMATTSHMIDVGLSGLRLMHAGLDEPLQGVLRRERRADLGAKIRELDADFVVLDLGIGLSQSLLDVWLDADLRLFVTVPEPTAVEGTFRFVRATFFRTLQRRLERQGRLGDLTLLMMGGPHPAPTDLVKRLKGHPLADEVEELIEDFDFRFVMNQARARSDLELGSAMASAARRRLGVRLGYMGYIDSDDAVLNSLRAGRPLLVESPGTKASRNIEKVARTLLAIHSGKRGSRYASGTPRHTHHDLLEVDRGATDEEVRRAYKRAKEVYAPGSLPTAGLFDSLGVELLRARLEEAHDVLLDPARRRPYELSVFPDAQAQELPDEEERLISRPRPPAPTITPETHFTGALLRAVRESQGVSLKEVSRHTKIGLNYLKAIEDDDDKVLPALVYVRGFVAEFAKYLSLDAKHVTRTYVRQFRRTED